MTASAIMVIVSVLLAWARQVVHLLYTSEIKVREKVVSLGTVLAALVMVYVSAQAQEEGNEVLPTCLPSRCCKR